MKKITHVLLSFLCLFLFAGNSMADYEKIKIAVLPFHPVRLAWHRAVFCQIERWLTRATQREQALLFAPDVLADQLQVVDRPRALIL